MKDAVRRLQEMVAGAIKAGERVRLTWAEILGQEPADDVRRRLNLESGMLCRIGKRLLKSALLLFFKTYNRLSVRGAEHLPHQGPYLVAPNHLSLADAPAVMAAVPWVVGSQMFFLGTTDYFGGPVTSKIAKALQVIPVDMDARLYGALQLSAYVLRKGKVLCVFPEGGRSRDGNLKEFKKGVGIIAKELNIPVVPVAIEGTYEMLATGMNFPRPAGISITFGRPIDPGDLDYEGIVKTLYGEVVKLQGKA